MSINLYEEVELLVDIAEYYASLAVRPNKTKAMDYFHEGRRYFVKSYNQTSNSYEMRAAYNWLIMSLFYSVGILNPLFKKLNSIDENVGLDFFQEQANLKRH